MGLPLRTARTLASDLIIGDRVMPDLGHPEWTHTITDITRANGRVEVTYADMDPLVDLPESYRAGSSVYVAYDPEDVARRLHAVADVLSDDPDRDDDVYALRCAARTALRGR